MKQFAILTIAVCGMILGPALPAQADDSGRCPAGMTPLEDPAGDFSGYCFGLSDADNIDVFVDQVTPILAVIEIAKDFNVPPGGNGVVPPLVIDFLQVVPDDQTVDAIYVSDESVTNQTGVDWPGFEWRVSDGPEAWFDIPASARFAVDPFLDASFADFPAFNQAKSLRADNGAVPNGTSFFPGIGAGELMIAVDLSPGDPVAFSLIEQPVPEGGFAVNHCTPRSQSACPAADVNCDDIVNGLDISLVANSRNFGKTVRDAHLDHCDVDGNGVVNGLDIAVCASAACFGR